MSVSKILVQDHINPGLNFPRINQIVAEKYLGSFEGDVEKSLRVFKKVIFIRKPQEDNFELA